MRSNKKCFIGRERTTTISLYQNDVIYNLNEVDQGWIKLGGLGQDELWAPIDPPFFTPCSVHALVNN